MIILKLSVRFTLKELRCEFSSFFDIISGSEERDILFLQIAVMFGINKVKEDIRYWNFFTDKKKKDHQFNKPINNLTNIANQEGVFFV